MGSFFAWGFLGPILVHYGICIGMQLAPGDPKWDAVVTFNAMSGMGEDGYVPSPRYWFLWPGVMVLLCYSMAEFFVHFKIIWYGLKYSWTNLAGTMRDALAKRGRNSPFLEKQAARVVGESSAVEDFATPDQQVANWVWVSGCVVVLAVTFIIFEIQYHISAGECSPRKKTEKKTCTRLYDSF